MAQRLYTPATEIIVQGPASVASPGSLFKILKLRPRFIRFKDSFYCRTQHRDSGVHGRQNSVLLTISKEKRLQAGPHRGLYPGERIIENCSCREQFRCDKQDGVSQIPFELVYLNNFDCLQGTEAIPSCMKCGPRVIRADA